MITAIVRFQLPAGTDPRRVAELFLNSAPKYEGLPGLIRKYYIYDAEKQIGGGCYLWESRGAALRFYDADWRKRIAESYGDPELSFFETPVVETTEWNDSDRKAAVFRLDVPAASLRPGLYTCQVNIVDDVAGAFAFPRFQVFVRR